MDLGAPVRPSSADTRPAQGHWCVSEPEACWSFPFELLPAPGDDAGEGEGSSDECVSATPLMSFPVITTQWIGLWHELCVVKQWPVVSWGLADSLLLRQHSVCGRRGLGNCLDSCLLVRIWWVQHAATHEEKPALLSPKSNQIPAPRNYSWIPLRIIISNIWQGIYSLQTNICYCCHLYLFLCYTNFRKMQQFLLRSVL